MNKLLSDVLKIMPSGLKTPLSFAFEDADGIYEVRMICGESVYLVTENGTMFLDENGNLSRFFPLNALKPTVSELSEITDRSIGYSGFFRENELKNGYFTAAGGIRVFPISGKPIRERISGSFSPFPRAFS